MQGQFTESLATTLDPPVTSDQIITYLLHAAESFLRS
jgi:hypothetical protein